MIKTRIQIIYPALVWAGQLERAEVWRSLGVGMHHGFTVTFAHLPQNFGLCLEGWTFSALSLPHPRFHTTNDLGMGGEEP